MQTALLLALCILCCACGTLPACTVYEEVPGTPPTYECRDMLNVVAMWNFKLPFGQEQAVPATIPDISGVAPSIDLSLYQYDAARMIFLQREGTDSHGVRVNNPTTDSAAKSGFFATPTKFYDSVMTQGRDFSVEMVVTPRDGNVDVTGYQGPARLVCMADSTAFCNTPEQTPGSNFHFAQTGTSVETRIRTVQPRACQTSVGPDVFVPGVRTHYAYTFNWATGVETIYHGGIQIVQRPAEGGPFTAANWNRESIFSLFTGPYVNGAPTTGRHWSGTMYYLAMYDAELSAARVALLANRALNDNVKVVGAMQVPSIMCPAAPALQPECGADITPAAMGTAQLTNCAGAATFVDTAAPAGACVPGQVITRTWSSPCGPTCEQVITHATPITQAPTATGAPTNAGVTAAPTVVAGGTTAAPTVVTVLPPGCVLGEPPAGAEGVEFVLTTDEDFDAFKCDDFLRDLATSMGVQFELLSLIKVLRGSVISTVFLRDSTPGSAAAATAQLGTNVQAGTVPGPIGTRNPTSLSANGDTVTAPTPFPWWILAIVGAILLAIIIIVIIVCCTRKRKKEAVHYQTFIPFDTNEERRRGMTTDFVAADSHDYHYTTDVPGQSTSLQSESVFIPGSAFGKDFTRESRIATGGEMRFILKYDWKAQDSKEVLAYAGEVVLVGESDYKPSEKWTWAMNQLGKEAWCPTLYLIRE